MEGGSDTQIHERQCIQIIVAFTLIYCIKQKEILLITMSVTRKIILTKPNSN